MTDARHERAPHPLGRLKALRAQQAASRRQHGVSIAGTFRSVRGCTTRGPLRGSAVPSRARKQTGRRNRARERWMGRWDGAEGMASWRLVSRRGCRCSQTMTTPRASVPMLLAPAVAGASALVRAHDPPPPPPRLFSTPGKIARAGASAGRHMPTRARLPRHPRLAATCAQVVAARGVAIAHAGCVTPSACACPSSFGRGLARRKGPTRRRAPAIRMCKLPPRAPAGTPGYARPAPCSPFRLPKMPPSMRPSLGANYLVAVGRCPASFRARSCIVESVLRNTTRDKMVSDMSKIARPCSRSRARSWPAVELTSNTIAPSYYTARLASSPPHPTASSPPHPNTASLHRRLAASPPRPTTIGSGHPRERRVAAGEITASLCCRERAGRGVGGNR